MKVCYGSATLPGLDGVRVDENGESRRYTAVRLVEETPMKDWQGHF